VQRNNSAASLWGITISPDTNTSKVLSTEVRYGYPVLDVPLTSFAVWNNNSQLVTLAIFGNCVILQVDFKTGATRPFATICDGTQRETTTAMDLDTAAGNLCVITQSRDHANPARQLVTVSLKSQQFATRDLAPLHLHNPVLEEPFEMTWIPKLNALLLFYTGNFDQLVWVGLDGTTTMAAFDLAEFETPEGTVSFTADDRLEDDDLWGDCAYDIKNNRLYFQCTITDDEGMVSEALCVAEAPATLKGIQWVNLSIWPLTYGYAGMQWVDVVA